MGCKRNITGKECNNRKTLGTDIFVPIQGSNTTIYIVDGIVFYKLSGLKSLPLVFEQWRSQGCQTGGASRGQGSLSGAQSYTRARTADAISTRGLGSPQGPPVADTFQIALGGFWGSSSVHLSKNNRTVVPSLPVDPVSGFTVRRTEPKSRRETPMQFSCRICTLKYYCS